MCADLNEERKQKSAAPVGAIHKRIGDGCVLCGHENPFDGWVPFVRIIPLRIDSLVEVVATFVKDITEKSKEFINKVEVLLPEDFTTKDTKDAKKTWGFWLVREGCTSQNHFAFGELMGGSCH